MSEEPPQGGNQGQAEKVHVKRVSNYITGKQLGRGTFGDVRLATHMITGERVAMKILEKEKIKCEDDFRRVVREIQVLKLLKNPNIVKLLEVIDTPRHIYLVTDFVDNGELFAYVVQNKRLKEDQACKFFRQIVNGVHYCHLRKVCHRDLKLENILLDSQLNVKIIDFGLSNVLAKDYKLKTACGSPSYASPEMLSQKKYDGPMVDVWACGVILFAMICGYLPFDDDDLQKLYKKIISGIFKIPSFVSPQAQDLIMKILVTDPSKRIPLLEIMKHPWFLEACADPIPKFQEIDPPTVIDFKIVYTMVQTLQDWDAVKIVKALSTNRHNQMTATYYLLSEKRQTENPDKIWKYDEQAHYAKALGFNLQEDGTVIFEPGQMDNEDKKEPVAEAPSCFNDNQGQSEYTKTDNFDDKAELEKKRLEKERILEEANKQKKQVEEKQEKNEE
ncbi:Kinase [Hexamita inflata]|uniref:non-specific serine/threonine protein kinase n=1 Tax=Hexamita inflata TaxID=28002 RepID=A0AA86Q7P5_9EUKA|nr:CAMK CAMKL [Hexamita inflata]CAI9929370.1 CAMK CAMKL [Hexamita inflata]CAI9947405.1 CAMK CAMKL [Hexamita inflata]